MARPDSFDPSSPTGAGSPRRGDDEIRALKLGTQEAYNDLHVASGVDVVHRRTYHSRMSVDMGGQIDIGTSSIDGPDVQKLSEVTASSTELNLLDGVTATTPEINVLDRAANTFMGVWAAEPEASNADPVIGDFTNGVNIIIQY